MPPRPSFRFLIVLAAALVLQAMVAVRAGTNQSASCEADCLAVVYDWVVADVEHFMPLNRLESEHFDSPAAVAACPVQRGTAPAVHAAVLAPDYPNYVTSESTHNDVLLLKDFFEERGVAADFLKITDGPEAARQAMIEALTKTLPCVRERDQVVLVLTGDATSYTRVSPRPELVIESMCASEEMDQRLQAFCDNAGKLTQEALESIQSTYQQAQADHDEMLFLASDVKLDLQKQRDDPDMRLAGLGAYEISNFVTQVRNRGADAIVLIDTNYAAAFDLLTYQRYAVMDGAWSWNTAWYEEPPEQDFNSRNVALFGTGHFAAYYAATSDQLAEMVNVDDSDRLLDPLVFAFTEALRQDPHATLVQTAAAITQEIADTGATQKPVFAASSKSLKLLEPAEPQNAAGQAIEIISPAPKRGAAAIEEKSFALVARYTGPGRAARAIVDGDLVTVDGNGQFRRDIADTGGKLSIPIRVLSTDFATLATFDLKLREAADEPVIAAGARKIALVIANQNYSGSDAFPALKTPIADAESVAKVLKDRFGFATDISTGGKTLNLFLKDAGKAQIQQVLYDLRQRLTPEDQLIVYYAGHGENDKDLGAYWVPADGQPKADFTWIAAEEITRELKRMNAGSILVISDSCYAGGLSRGAATEQPAIEARERYLAKASRLKSRQLMASGGEEPVEDGGGGGHSVFANALIKALETMPDKTFTASELFEQKVKPAVISAASAVTEGQTPGFNRIAKAGDEPGSEFVFQVSP